MFLLEYKKKEKFLKVSFFIIILALFGLLSYYFSNKFVYIYNFLLDKSRIEVFILSKGWYAPLFFMALQIIQVLFAPIPGEVTGFLGGYIFGTALGFLYSSISLALGSWIFFFIGHFFSKKYIISLIPLDKLKKINKVISKKGFVSIFLCFLIPGFPKDYLCLFLGIVNMPLNKFLIATTFGRMPGTLFLSVQGSSLFESNYCFLLISTVIILAIISLSFKYKKYIYNIIDRLD